VTDTQTRHRYPATLSARLPAEAAERIRKMAAADDRPPTTLARRWILDGLRRAEEKAGATSA
jgi:predicted transcriptional regulator